MCTVSISVDIISKLSNETNFETRVYLGQVTSSSHAERQTTIHTYTGNLESPNVRLWEADEEPRGISAAIVKANASQVKDKYFAYCDLVKLQRLSFTVQHFVFTQKHCSHIHVRWRELQQSQFSICTNQPDLWHQVLKENLGAKPVGACFICSGIFYWKSVCGRCMDVVVCAMHYFKHLQNSMHIACSIQFSKSNKTLHGLLDCTQICVVAQEDVARAFEVVYLFHCIFQSIRHVPSAITNCSEPCMTHSMCSCSEQIEPLTFGINAVLLCVLEEWHCGLSLSHSTVVLNPHTLYTIFHAHFIEGKQGTIIILNL